MSKNTQITENVQPARKNSETSASRNQKLGKIHRTYPLPPLAHSSRNGRDRKYGVIPDATKLTFCSKSVKNLAKKTNIRPEVMAKHSS